MVEARQNGETDRYRPSISAAVLLKTEMPFPASIERDSGVLPNASAPTEITLKIGKPSLTTLSQSPCAFSTIPVTSGLSVSKLEDGLTYLARSVKWCGKCQKCLLVNVII